MQPMEMQSGQPGYDQVNQENALLALSDEGVRSGFIRKVYSLLSIQLVLTGAIAYPIYQLGPQWVAMHRQYVNAAMILSLVLVIGVSCCCQEVARKFPTNYMFLFAVTACEGVICGFVSAMYAAESVVLALALTAGIFLGLTVYALTTKTDFTGMSGYLSAAIWGLILGSLVCMFFPSPMMQKMIGAFGAILFSFYIVYDTQLIIGGKHTKNQYRVDDYVFAALSIYLDIINLFLYLLSLFGERR